VILLARPIDVAGVIRRKSRVGNRIAGVAADVWRGKVFEKQAEPALDAWLTKERAAPKPAIGGSGWLPDEPHAIVRLVWLEE